MFLIVLVRDSHAYLPVWVECVICHCTHLSDRGRVASSTYRAKAVRAPQPLGQFISAALTLNNSCQSETAGPMARLAQNIHRAALH